MSKNEAPFTGRSKRIARWVRSTLAEADIRFTQVTAPRSLFSGGERCRSAAFARDERLRQRLV